MNSIRIAMWSGPRCISTAMMRSFENRDDTVVVDEPFYAHYLTMAGMEHPMRDEIINNYEFLSIFMIFLCIIYLKKYKTII